MSGLLGQCQGRPTTIFLVFSISATNGFSMYMVHIMKINQREIQPCNLSSGGVTQCVNCACSQDWPICIVRLGSPYLWCIRALADNVASICYKLHITRNLIRGWAVQFWSQSNLLRRLPHKQKKSSSTITVQTQACN